LLIAADPRYQVFEIQRTNVSIHEGERYGVIQEHWPTY
jgi:hypothetical protein